MLTFSAKGASDFVAYSEIEQLRPQLDTAHDLLRQGRGAGCEYLGWLKLPLEARREEISRINQAASQIRRLADVLVVIGIGGSYLGAKAAIEMLGHSFPQLQKKSQRKAPLVLFAGNNLSSDYLNDLFDVLANKKLAINVISKSGTTTEPAIAFRIFKRYLEERYGKEGARERIFVTTDSSRGVLRRLADEEGYTSFVVPDDIGGRFSVLTAVGLLPIAVAGINIRQLLTGARDGARAWQEKDPALNPCYAYAAWRNVLLRKGYCVEYLVNYEPSLHYFTEWWKQLFGESEGKDGRGILPAGVDNTADLHSMGQYIQDGRRFLFETVLRVEKSRRPLLIPQEEDDGDGLNFLAGLDLDQVNHKAAQGTVLAHVDGGVPNLALTLPERSPYYFGQLVYFFELACAISGYLLAINPFDQPGVEAYKENMYALLGKPGFEQLRAELLARLEDDN